MRKAIISIFVSVLLFSANYGYAEEIETAGDYMASIGTKFGRGLENIITSPAEIPCTMNHDMRGGDPFAGFFTGLGKGTVFFLRRALVGVTEVGSFVVPMERTIPTVCSDQPLPKTE